MDSRRQKDEAALRLLFDKFVRTGLTGQLDAFIELLEEPYTGVGLGEQGFVNSKAQVERIMRDGYKSENGDKIDIEITELMINFMHEDAAILSGAVTITTTQKSGEVLRSGLTQTMGARRKGECWVVGFTHASVAILTKESVEAYPIKFMDNTLSRLKAEMHPDVVLYAEVNLTTNSVIHMEGRFVKKQMKDVPYTLKEVAEYGLSGEIENGVLTEYNSFFDRLRLLGLYAEGVKEDQFSYCLYMEERPAWIQVEVKIMRSSYTGDISAVITYKERHDYKNELKQLSRKAFHDALTGILNREGFERKAAELLDSYKAKDRTALYMIDLDDFKHVNDRLGHQVGDTMLRQVAGVLQDAFRDSGAVGRIGGDEFMILITGEFTLDWVEQKADELLAAMRLQMGTGKQIPVSISIGIAFGRARATFDKLYRIADIALYTAKKAGKSRFHLINADNNADHTITQAGSNLISLQTLLNYTDERETVQNRTPYEALIENIPGGVMVMSLSDKLRINHCNDWVNKIFGYKNGEVEEMQRDDPLILVHPDDLPAVYESIERMREGQEKVNVTYRALGNDGFYRHLNLSASMTERSKDEVLYYGIITDVDEMMRLQRELKASREQLDTILNAIPGGIAVYELTDVLRVKHYGNWIYEYSGYTQKETENISDEISMNAIWPEDIPLVMEEMQRLIDGADKCDISLRLVHKDGHPIPVRVFGSVTERIDNKVIMYAIYMLH